MLLGRESAYVLTGLSHVKHSFGFLVQNHQGTSFAIGPGLNPIIADKQSRNELVPARW